MLRISATSSDELFVTLFQLEVGMVFYWSGDLNEVLKTIAIKTPEGQTFSVRGVTPGTSLYTLYNTCLVVVENSGYVAPEIPS